MKFFLNFFIVTFLVFFPVPNNSEEAPGQQCDTIKAFYQKFSKKVVTCGYNNKRQVIYWDIDSNVPWDAAQLACVAYSNGKSDLAVIRDADELTVLRALLPGEQFRGHWINFRLDESHGKNVFEAIKKHDLKWEDGTELTFHNWHGADASCANFPGCLATWDDGTFSLTPCRYLYRPLCQIKI